MAYHRQQGVCRSCGGPTWDRWQATICRQCYHARLRERVGSANPAWGHFSSEAIDQGRDRTRRRFPLGLCERCGRRPAFDRHHKDGNTLNIEPSNVAALCRRCHMKIDGRLAALRKRIIERNRSKP